MSKVCNYTEFISLTEQVGSLIEKANLRELSWEEVFDKVFSEDISVHIRGLGLSPDYYDPDTSYKEDVLAYYNALVRDAKEYEEWLDLHTPKPDVSKEAYNKLKVLADKYAVYDFHELNQLLETFKVGD